jgi:hypothetical protein
MVIPHTRGVTAMKKVGAKALASPDASENDKNPPKRIRLKDYLNEHNKGQ